MSIALTEKELAQAQARLDRALKALRFPHGNAVQAEYDAADAEVLRLQRKLAAAKGQEFAEPLDFPVRWDVGAPLPQVLVNDHRCFLIFYLADDTVWDGKTASVVDPSDGSKAELAMVEFERAASVKLGAPNDEVFHGHPLHGRGSAGYFAERVINSAWLRELEAINSVHAMYRPESWRDLNHYVFWFHDSTFECVARSFTLELHSTSLVDLLAEGCRRLVL